MKRVRAVVVGAGMSGLCCAQSLVRAGHEVVVVSAGGTRSTTSHLAAAVWFPTAIGPEPAVARWGARTFEVLAAEAAAGVPGVMMRESLALHRGAPERSLPRWTEAVRELRAASREELPPGYSSGLRYVVPLVEMPVYPPHMFATLLDDGVQHLLRRLTRLEEVLDLDPDVVVNAAGLAAGPLVGDDSVFPVRGQIVRVANPGLTMSVRDEAHPGGRAYVHPRTTDCILGGTLEVGSWDTEPDPKEASAIVERCVDIAPPLAGVRVIESVVGLRPGRPEVRVELERDLLPVPVVHNYGHGGAGITVGWGCAEQVAAIVGDLANR